MLFAILKNTALVKAETILFQDDFSNDFEKWESVRDNFDMWSIIDSQANIFVNKRATLAELVPKDIYWDPEWKNIIYELDYKYIQGADKNISFGFKDVLNWYEIHFVGGSYFLSHLKEGRLVWDNTGFFNLIDNVTHHIVINLNEGSIIVSIDGNEVINVIDPTFNNDYGKIGIKAGTGSVYPSQAIYDNIIVKSLQNFSNKLDITPQKQTNPIWANDEYDSASNWASNKNQIKIDHWGCLISSISMIMNFHGINIMPDNTPVNPATINSWLKSQPDGYIQSGLVNSLAITRLTKIINDQYSTSKLEYRRVPGNDFLTAKNEISANKPVILEIPGHFLVGNGITKDNNDQEDLYITDPSYNYEKFSQHNKELLSTRTFEPTFTDLSYLHISHDPSINIKITREDGLELNNLQSFNNYISDFITDENSDGGGYTQNDSPTVRINEIEKPTNGTYIIEITQDNFNPFKLTIFAYSKEGALSQLSYSGLVGKNPIKLKLIYDNENISTLEKNIDFETLLNDINELYDVREIKKHYVAKELEKLAQFAKTVTDINSNRYLEAFQQLIEWYSPQLTQEGKLYLNQRLTEIKGIID